MSCSICCRSSCASWMHSKEEQEKYADIIEMEEKIHELRQAIEERIDEIDAEEEED